MAIGVRIVPRRPNRSNRAHRFHWLCLGGLGVVLSLVTLAGCGQPQADAPARAAGPVARHPAAVEPQPAPVVPTGYGPERIAILPLTELLAGENGARLEVYVSVLDAFGSPIKTPATVWVELYEYAPRSARPKGERIDEWLDIDLTDSTENNKRWRDLLRAYQFDFPTQAARDRPYILEVTCLCSGGKRLSAEHTLKSGQ